MIETGKTYRLTYGNGTQLFHVVRISKKGKPFGFRFVGTQGWTVSSLKVNDVRLRDEWTSSRSISGDSVLDAIPEVLTAKADLAPLKADLAPLKADLDSARAAFSEYQERLFAKEADTGINHWNAQEGDGFGELIKEGNTLRPNMYTANDRLGRAKSANSLVASKGDLASF